MTTIAKPLTRIKRQLRRRKFTYRDVAILAGVSYDMAYRVISGRRKSRKVLDAIMKLLGNGRQGHSPRQR